MSERWTLRAEPEHLPPVPFSSEGLHQGIINPAGEVIATVWNHHGDEITVDIAQAMTQLPRMLGLIGLMANWLGQTDHAMVDEAAAILRACGREP